MNEKSTGLGMVVGGLVIGGLVGAVAVLLAAPQSGVQTRMMIKEKSVQFKEKVAAGATTTKEQAQKALVDLRERASKITQNSPNQILTDEGPALEIINPTPSSEGESA
jgi:gas vesicle protein